MPEAPDVEVVAKYLRKVFLGLKVTSAKHTGQHEQVMDLVGCELTEVSVHGKHLYCTWVGARTLYSNAHFMLHGRMYDRAHHSQPDGLYFSLHFGGKTLDMYDHMKKSVFEVQDEPFVREGVCVLSGQVTAELVKQQCHGRASVAVRLNEQTFIVGIGHILCNEVLASSHVYPRTSCHLLTDEQLEAIAEACNNIPTTMAQCGGYKHTRVVTPDGTQGFYTATTYRSAKNTIKKVHVGGKMYYTEEEAPR